MKYEPADKKTLLGWHEGHRKFLQAVNRYAQYRSEKDPEWKAAREFDAFIDVVVFGVEDEVEIEWTITDRCGDSEGYHKTFPARHLWDAEAAEADIQARRRAVEEKRAARVREEKRRVEERERAQLAALQEKYGGQAVPGDPS